MMSKDHFSFINLAEIKNLITPVIGEKLGNMFLVGV